jgi:decaprenylphospho-beta-D-erythro-pentofuranosid-2-ulose 2-reductase
MQTVLILGAVSDIAEAIAYAYAERGDDVILAARNTSRLDRVGADMQIRFGKTPAIAEFDAVDFNSHAAFYQNLPKAPDTVVCVFGFMDENINAMNNFAIAKQTIDVNYTGAVSILNIVANDMASKGKGTIIGISSVAGERGRQSNFIYGSAKAGFTAYLAGLRNYLFHKGVHVLTVKPGFVKTKMTANLPLNPKLTAQPKQIAKDVLKAADKKKNVLYSLWMWKYIMAIIKNIPEGVFKKLKM